MDKVSCLAYLLHQSDDEKVKNIAIQLLNGDVSLNDIKKRKDLKTYFTAIEAKIKKVDTHQVALFVEKFMVMEV